MMKINFRDGNGGRVMMHELAVAIAYGVPIAIVLTAFIFFLAGPFSDWLER